MRTLRRNKQTMYYCKPTGTAPKYNRDASGNIIYLDILDDDGKPIPSETGEYEPTYSEPVEFSGSIHSQLENAIMRAWGNDNTNNYAVLVVGKGEVTDLTNGCRVWRTSTVGRKSDNSVDGSTADYLVAGVLDEELHEDSYYLQKLEGGSRATV